MKFTKHKLKNGFRYILAPMRNTQAVSVMVLVGTGLMYEKKEENGLAHFLEHMCFKGTTTRPSSMHIVEELDMLGARHNAFTGAYSTGYWAKGHKKNAVELVDIISDLYLNPIFPESEMEKEKGVVIQEINMYEDNPSAKVGQVIDELMYGDQAAGREIIGTKKTVNSFTREDLIRYRNTHYTVENTLVVIAGAFNRATVEKHIKKQFSQIKKTKRPTLQPTVIKQKDASVKIHYKQTDQTHFVLSFHAPTMFDKRESAVSALSTILGESSSSRLFKKMREELGICYYIGSSFQAGMESGTFSVYAGVANDRLEEAVHGIVTELRLIKEELAGKEEFQRCKNMRLSGLVLGLETSNAVADRCAFQELYHGKIRSIEESTKRIEGVSVNQMRQAALDIFQTSKANLAIVGPHKNDKKLKKLLTF
ncbi:MAG: pitrilysin family protein [Patescibacteria group bacterium]